MPKPNEFDLEKELGEFAYGETQDEDDKDEINEFFDKKKPVRGNVEDVDPDLDDEEDDERKDDNNKENPEPEPEPEDDEEEDEDGEGTTPDGERPTKNVNTKEESRLKQELAILKDTIDDLKNELKSVSSKKEDKPAEFKLDELTDEKFEKITESKEEFMDFFGSAIKKAVEFSREETLKSIPSLVDKKVQVVNEHKRLAQEFYENNPDLYEFKEYVGRTANKIAEKNPDMDVPEIFKETEREVRKKLGKSKKSKGKLPKVKSSTRRGSDVKKLNDFEKDFDELANVV